MNNRSELWIRAHRQRLLKPDPGPLSPAFLAFKVALLKAGTTPEEREANAPATRAARAEAKSCLSALLSAEFQKVYTPEIAAAAARKEALKVVNRWSRRVIKEADDAPSTLERTPPPVNPPEDAQGAAPGTPPPDASRRSWKRSHAVGGAVGNPTSNCAGSSAIGRRFAPPYRRGSCPRSTETILPEPLGPGLVTRTVGIGNQPVSLVHEDLSGIYMDHPTGEFMQCPDY